MGSLYLYSRFSNLNRVSINFSASGDQTIISADATRRIIIYRLWLVVAGATALTFKDSLASPAAISLAANEGITFDASGEPWFATNVNQAFIINSSLAVGVGGIAYYAVMA